MLSENEIISKFEQHGLFQGRELYLKVPLALEFLAACQENDLAIIGVEAFRNENNYLIPLLDHIADFSYYETSEWEEFKNSCNESCKSFLLGLSKENKIVFNFILMTRDEWEDKRIS